MAKYAAEQLQGYLMTVVSSASLHKPYVIDLPRSPERRTQLRTHSCRFCVGRSTSKQNLIGLLFFFVCSWRTVIWPPAHLSSTERDKLIKDASQHVFITKPQLGQYQNSVKVGQPNLVVAE